MKELCKAPFFRVEYTLDRSCRKVVTNDNYFRIASNLEQLANSAIALRVRLRQSQIFLEATVGTR